MWEGIDPAVRPLRQGLCLLLLCLGGCTAVPSDGPATMDMVLSNDASAQGGKSYVLAQLDEQVLRKINALPPRSFTPEFREGFKGSGSYVLGVGDRLVVNIWEASSDGIFTTESNRQAKLQIVVEEDGRVYVPYAGRIRARGQTVERLRSAIEEGLAGKAVEPQVQVVLEDNQANAVVVMGDVAKPGQLPIPLRGMRLMEAVARAGGTRGPSYETIATVTRKGRSQAVRLGDMVAAPENDIWLAPADKLMLLHQPRAFSAFGAVKRSGLLPFKSESLTLAEALAQTGGLLDQRADAGGIFLLRFEERALARWLTVEGRGEGSLDAHGSGVTPVIYRLDFKDPRAFFIAQGLKMRDKDILYVATHPSAEFNKFLTGVVAPFVGTARGTVVLVE